MLPGMERTVTEVRPDKQAPGWVWIYVNGKRAVRLTERSASALQIARGTPWDADLHARAALASRADLARKAARRLIAVRERSEAELRTRLGAKGHDAEAIEQALEILRTDGLVDDAALAARAAESRMRQKPQSRRAVIRRLQDRGVTHTSAAQAAEDAAGVRSEADLAEEALRARIGDGAPPPAVRLQGFLLRRGFDHEAIEEAMRRVLGGLPGEDDAAGAGNWEA